MKITAVNTFFVRPRWGFVEIITDEDRTYLIERLCQMGLSKEDVDTLGIHHYIL